MDYSSQHAFANPWLTVKKNWSFNVGNLDCLSEDLHHGLAFYHHFFKRVLDSLMLQQFLIIPRTDPTRTFYLSTQLVQLSNIPNICNHQSNFIVFIKNGSAGNHYLFVSHYLLYNSYLRPLFKDFECYWMVKDLFVNQFLHVATDQVFAR